MTNERIDDELESLSECEPWVEEITKEQKLERELKRAKDNLRELQSNVSIYISGLPTIKIKKGLEEEWEKVFKNNQKDDYSRGAIECALYWAKALQPLVDCPFGDKMVFNTLCMVDRYGLTGFQVDCIVATLRKYWEYGEYFFPEGVWYR